MTLMSTDTSWYVDALCRETDPYAFFPARTESAQPAKDVCNLCPVRAECLQYALVNEEWFGVWGGYSEMERRRMRALPAFGRGRRRSS